MPITLDDLNIVQTPLSASQYVKEMPKKTQIVLHHTVSNRNAANVIRGWDNTPEKVATAVVVGGDGVIHQAYSSKYWASHLGLGTKHFTPLGLKYQNLDKNSIGIEICAYGPLKYDGGEFKTIYGQTIPRDEVEELETPFKKHKFWHTYTDEQIESVEKLLKYWTRVYDIPLVYNEDMWDISKEAMSGAPGIWNHTSYRTDKSDCYPAANLIAMLKGL